MPARHGARSVPAAPILLRAEPLGVLWRGPETPRTLGRGWAWRGSARSIPAAATATLRPSLPRHCHVPPAPADAQEAEPPQPSAPGHPWTPTWPRSWGSRAGCCQNPVPQFPPAVLSPSHSMGSSLPAPQPHTLILSPTPAPPEQTPRSPPGLMADPWPRAGLCRTLLWGSAPSAPSQSGPSPSPSPGLWEWGTLPLSPHPLAGVTLHPRKATPRFWGVWMFGCSLGGASGATREDKRNFRGWQRRWKGTNINPPPGPPCPYSDVPLHPDPKAALHPAGST